MAAHYKESKRDIVQRSPHDLVSSHLMGLHVLNGQGTNSFHNLSISEGKLEECPSPLSSVMQNSFPVSMGTTAPARCQSVQRRFPAQGIAASSFYPQPLPISHAIRALSEYQFAAPTGIVQHHNHSMNAAHMPVFTPHWPRPDAFGQKIRRKSTLHERHLAVLEKKKQDAADRKVAVERSSKDAKHDLFPNCKVHLMRAQAAQQPVTAKLPDRKIDFQDESVRVASIYHEKMKLLKSLKQQKPTTGAHDIHMPHPVPLSHGVSKGTTGDDVDSQHQHQQLVECAKKEVCAAVIAIAAQQSQDTLVHEAYQASDQLVISTKCPTPVGISHIVSRAGNLKQQMRKRKRDEEKKSS